MGARIKTRTYCYRTLTCISYWLRCVAIGDSDKCIQAVFIWPKGCFKCRTN